MRSTGKSAASNPVWVCSELYYPEDTSTGFFLTHIAEALAAEPGLRVSALCARPTYAHRGALVPAEEVRNGVRIVRCRATTLDRERLATRLVNLVTISASMFWTALRRCERGSCIVVVTNPPLLPALMALVARMRGCRCVLLVHDVYPDVLEVAGLIAPSGTAARLIRRAWGYFLRRMTAVVVLGRDMRERLLAVEPGIAGRTRIVTNWADDDEVRPVPKAGTELVRRLGLADRFVVQLSGNIGRTHDAGVVARCVRRLRGPEGDRVHLLVASSGRGSDAIRAGLDETDLGRVTFLDRQPRGALNDLLNACDVALIPFVRGMAGLSVPSRMYNLMAAARPIVAVADRRSELALVLEEEDAGWVVEPGDDAGLARLLSSLSRSPAEVARRGANAARAARQRYARGLVLDRWRELVAAQFAEGAEKTAADGVRRVGHA